MTIELGCVDVAAVKLWIITWSNRDAISVSTSRSRSRLETYWRLGLGLKAVWGRSLREFTAGSDDVMRLAEVEALDALVDAEDRLVGGGARAGSSWPRMLLLLLLLLLLGATACLWRRVAIRCRCRLPVTRLTLLLMVHHCAADRTAYTDHDHTTVCQHHFAVMRTYWYMSAALWTLSVRPSVCPSVRLCRTGFKLENKTRIMVWTFSMLE